MDPRVGPRAVQPVRDGHPSVPGATQVLAVHLGDHRRFGDLNGTAAHTLAVALRDSSVMLGGYNNHTSALDDASLQVPQSEFDAGTRIFYGLTTGGNPTRGLYELTSYSQARIIRTRVGVWVGPLATEQRAVELIEAHEFVKPVANEAAAIADGDRTGVLYLWP